MFKRDTGSELQTQTKMGYQQEAGLCTQSLGVKGIGYTQHPLLKMRVLQESLHSPHQPPPRQPGSQNFLRQLYIPKARHWRTWREQKDLEKRPTKHFGILSTTTTKLTYKSPQNKGSPFTISIHEAINSPSLFQGLTFKYKQNKHLRLLSFFSCYGLLLSLSC